MNNDYQISKSMIFISKNNDLKIPEHWFSNIKTTILYFSFIDFIIFETMI